MLVITGVYTNVLEAADCERETKSSVLAMEYKCFFSIADFTEMVSSNGCFS